MADSAHETWGGGEAYERYVGRWSRLVAGEFIGWLAAGPGLVWGDVGCGTGALAECILRAAQPAAIMAIDRAEGFVRAARQRSRGPFRPNSSIARTARSSATHTITFE